jgi:predicted ArsR family transcriptional regulator
MSERRDEVLGLVHQAAQAIGVAEVADRLGIHPNTARFHLEALTGAGFLERTYDKPSGRGRPRVGYRARPGLARGRTRRYRMLAEILLGQLATRNDAPAAAAADAGHSWGAHLVSRPAPFRAVTRDEAVRRLVALLDELDFAPEAVADGSGTVVRIRLRHCPFLELAEPHPDLVCPVHLGLMKGALAELRASVTVGRLEPFAEPTACLAHLEAAAT